MNNLYIHQLETENKQLRETLKSTNEVVKEYLDKEKYCDELENKIDKAIEYIKDYIEYYGLHIQNDEMEKSYYKRLEELLAILGDKENE